MTTPSTNVTANTARGTIEMNSTQLIELISTKDLIDFQRTDQNYESDLRLMLRDRESGELGILQIGIEPFSEEPALGYWYEEQRS